MLKNLLLTLVLIIPLGLAAQNASVSVDYTIPNEVEYGEDLEIEVEVTNDGTVDVDSDVIFNFNVETDFPTSFPPPATFTVLLDYDDDDLEPGDQVTDDFEIDTDEQANNFTANKQNIVTIWPKVTGNDGSETLEYFFGEIDVIDGDTQPTAITIKEIPQVTITPNPTTDYINLELPVAHLGQKLYIYSTFGQHVGTHNIQSKEIVNLDIASLTTGMYILNIRDADNKVIYWGRFSKIETR